MPEPFRDPDEAEAKRWLDSVVRPDRCNLYDFSKVKVVDGVIYYRLYQQDGTMVAMRLPDNLSNRLFVSWVQIHDRA